STGQPGRLASGGEESTGGPMDVQREGPGVVVLHVSDLPADLERAIGAAGRIVRARPATTARIIVNGPALTGLLGGEALAPPPGVSVEACQFGLEQRGLSMNDVRPGVASVPMAVVALVDAQHAGAAYIRL